MPKTKRKFPRRRRAWTLLQRLGPKGWFDPAPMHEWERHVLMRDVRRAVEDGVWRADSEGIVRFTAHDIRMAFPDAYTGNGGRLRPRSKALEDALERLHSDGSLHRSGPKNIARFGRVSFAAQSYILNPDRERLRSVA